MASSPAYLFRMAKRRQIEQEALQQRIWTQSELDSAKRRSIPLPEGIAELPGESVFPPKTSIQRQLSQKLQQQSVAGAPGSYGSERQYDSTSPEMHVPKFATTPHVSRKLSPIKEVNENEGPPFEIPPRSSSWRFNRGSVNASFLSKESKGNFEKEDGSGSDVESVSSVSTSVLSFAEFLGVATATTAERAKGAIIEVGRKASLERLAEKTDVDSQKRKENYEAQRAVRKGGN
jgi:hypothetical protein